MIERAIQTVKVLPDCEAITIRSAHAGDCSGWPDPGKIERAMLNLLFNACEAVSPPTGRVDVTAERSSRGIEIRVADNGPGIPEPIRDTIFQPFASYGKEKGIGLGLTVAQKLVQDHGGEVAVERSGPSGTVFWILLPKIEGPPPAQPSARA